MAADKDDYFQKVGRSTATTLSAPGYTIGNTTINVASTANWGDSTGVTFAIDEVDSDGVRIAGTYNVFRGVVSSATQVSDLEYVGGDANRDYSAGATTRVYVTVSSYRDNRLIDGILVHADQDGTLKAGAVDNAAVLASDVVETAKIKDLNVTTAKIDDGAVTDEKQTSTVAFKAYNTNASQTLSASPTMLTLAGEEYDLGSNFSSSTFTAPYDGIYSFSGRLSRENNTLAWIAIALYVDRGSGYAEEARGNYVTGTPAKTGAVVSTDLKLSATNKVRLYVWCNGAVSDMASGKELAYFTGHMVGRA